MDIADLATLGARIVELSHKLKAKKNEREILDKDITALESELMPLVTEHSKVIASVVGAALPAPVPYVTPPHALPNGPRPQQQPKNDDAPPPIPTPDAAVKKKVLDYLRTAEEPGSAQTIAEALRLDPLVVRQVLSELARPR